MEMEIKCPNCEEVYSVDKSLIGELVKCENCGTTFTAVENPLSEKDRTNGIEKWINDFFNFKVMITPSLIRLEFLLLFISASVSSLVYPFQIENRSITWRILMSAVFLFVGIPLLAILLHTIYELTMIPFVILETLLEIRNKLDEKAKS